MDLDPFNTLKYLLPAQDAPPFKIGSSLGISSMAVLRAMWIAEQVVANQVIVDLRNVTLVVQSPAVRIKFGEVNWNMVNEFWNYYVSCGEYNPHGDNMLIIGPNARTYRFTDQVQKTLGSIGYPVLNCYAPKNDPTSHPPKPQIDETLKPRLLVVLNDAKTEAMVIQYYSSSSDAYSYSGDFLSIPQLQSNWYSSKGYQYDCLRAPEDPLYRPFPASQTSNR